MNLIKLAQQKIVGMNRVITMFNAALFFVKSLINLILEEEELNGIPDC